MRHEWSASPPELVRTEEELDEILTRPRALLLDAIRALKSPLVLLGAGGKMGPSLAVLARRAAEAAGEPLEVVAVSRFSDGRARRWLEEHGVRTVSADLLERSEVDRLPEAENVIYLAGFKFGATGDPARMWAINTVAPAHAALRYARARIAALSTGNVYPLVAAAGGGSVETDLPAPVGEYGNAALARERIFEFYSRQNGTPMLLIRLNYAVDLRYGVLVDIARKVWTGEPVDVSMGHVNCIWQGDANDMIIRSLALARLPPRVLNLTGQAALSVRDLALRLGALLGRPVEIAGAEASSALLSNSTQARALLGEPPTPLDAVVRWTAHWLSTGGRLLEKPTRFEVRDGKF